MKTIKFYTAGCKVNQYDTQAMREQFLGAGFEELSNGLPADIYLINTCTVTHHADSDSLGFIYRARRQNPHGLIIVTGCLTELDEDKLKGKGVDLIVKNKGQRDILKFLSLDSARENKGVTYFKNHTRAFLKIQDGCNNFCSFCKVAYVRGKPRSKGMREIIAEAKNLVKNGFKEIVLCGVCLGAYGRDMRPRQSLVDVIEKLESLDGLLRIRLSSIEPRDVTGALIKKIASSGKLCPHLHIPLQSADKEILKKMKRNYTPEFYLGLVRNLRKLIPDIAITTDVLVGFGGETEAQFKNTLEVIKKIMPLKAHIFPYSKREGTLAARMFPADVSGGIIKKRISRLNKIARECSVKYRRRFLNKDALVLVEGYSKKQNGFQEGYSRHYIRVCLKKEQNMKNNLVKARLLRILGDAMCAEAL